MTDHDNTDRMASFCLSTLLDVLAAGDPAEIEDWAEGQRQGFSAALAAAKGAGR